MTAHGSEPERVDVVLFDLGGVVFDFDWDRAIEVWSTHSGVPAADLVARFRTDGDYERYERGEVGSDEYFSLLRHELDIDVDVAVIEQGWNAIFGDLVDGITETIAAVRASPLRIAALSNTNAAHAATFNARFAPVIADLGRIFVSHELGHRKPERACFEAACSHLATDPAHVLFFDDTLTNVAAARDAGLQAVHVRNLGDVHTALAALGVHVGAIDAH